MALDFLRWFLAGKRGTARADVPVKYSNCFGREEVRYGLVAAAKECGCALLFGGRQSGKTTILHAVERDLASTRSPVGLNSRVDIPVYIDLQRLPYDATPVDFFDFALERAGYATSQQIVGLDRVVRSVRGDPRSVDRFRAQILAVRESVDLDLHFIFLIDEAKRVLTTRFPRGFQDNLFSLMFGSASGPYSFVLAGAQDLYRLYEDSTSPIGSRTAKRIVCNLSSDAVREIVRAFHPGIEESMLEERKVVIYDLTSGHAGLSADLARRFATHPDATTPTLMNIANAVRAERSELFHMWAHKLSPEARLVSEALIRAGRMTLRNVAAFLRLNALPAYRVDRVSEELQFTGIAIREDDRLVAANSMYIEMARNYVTTDSGTDEEQEVWGLIRDVETGLRCLIRSEFDRKWPGAADDRMKGILGERAWNGLLQMRAKSEQSYGFTPRLVTEVLDCAYLGQLGELMKANSSWDLFRDMFRDKRELEDMLKDVTPVRNDFAHFRSVPERERYRSKLRCEDLLAIIAKRVGPN